VAGLGLAACSSEGDSSADDSSVDAAGVGASTGSAAEVVPFDVDRQAGVLRAPTEAGIVAAFDVTTADRDVLAATMLALSTEIAQLLRSRRDRLGDPRSDAWPQLYREILTSYSWGLPADLRDAIRAKAAAAY